MKKASILIILSFIYILSFAQKNNSIKDITIIQIGKQLWMSYNLNVLTFRNGDTIMYAKSKEDWIIAAKGKKPAWCYYNNDIKIGEKYGKLYNWYAVNDKRGLAPIGWKVPSEKDLKELIKHLGGHKRVNSIGSEGGYGNLAEKIASIKDWSGNWGKNTSGFNAYPSGCIMSETFKYIYTSAFFWLSNSSNTEKSYAFVLNGDFPDIGIFSNSYGFSIRCILDK